MKRNDFSTWYVRRHFIPTTQLHVTNVAIVASCLLRLSRFKVNRNFWPKRIRHYCCWRRLHRMSLKAFVKISICHTIKGFFMCRLFTNAMLIQILICWTRWLVKKAARTLQPCRSYTNREWGGVTYHAYIRNVACKVCNVANKMDLTFWNLHLQNINGAQQNVFMITDMGIYSYLTLWALV